MPKTVHATLLSRPRSRATTFVPKRLLSRSNLSSCNALLHKMLRRNCRSILVARKSAAATHGGVGVEAEAKPDFRAKGEVTVMAHDRGQVIAASSVTTPAGSYVAGTKVGAASPWWHGCLARACGGVQLGFLLKVISRLIITAETCEASSPCM